MMKKTLLLSVLLIIGGCSSLPESVDYEEASKNKNLLVDQYYIGVDDVVSVNVWKNPDLSIQVPVRPDGKISVPLAGILNELRSHEYLSRVRVTGAVRSPISINFRQGMTIVDAVLAAGGVNEFASANSAKLYRRIDGKVEKINIDLDDILKGGDLRTNILVQPGDILIVPERVF